MNVPKLGSRVDYPDVRHAELKVVANLIFQIARTVIFGKDLNHEKWGRPKDLFFRLLADVDAHVGCPEAGRFYLQPLFRECVCSESPAVSAEEVDQFPLSLAMILLSQVSLHDAAVKILSVSVAVAGPQVFLNGNKGRWRRHIPILELAPSSATNSLETRSSGSRF